MVNINDIEDKSDSSVKNDSSEEEIEAVSGDRIVCTLRKCLYCRHYVKALNMARHVKNKHPHRIIKRSHHKDKYKSVSEAKSEGVTFVCPPPCGKIFILRIISTVTKRGKLVTGMQQINASSVSKYLQVRMLDVII